MNYQGNASLIVVETASFSGTRIIKSQIDRVTSIAEQPQNNLPQTYALHQNYPNPFNPETKISFQLPNAENYHLEIFNVAGQQVTSFTGYAHSGITEINWDATGMASGLYYYRLSSGDFFDPRNMLLLQ